MAGYLPAHQVNYSRNPDPWILIWDQRKAIYSLPLLTQPTIDVLRSSTIRRSPSTFGHIDKSSAFKYAEFEAICSQIWRTNHPLCTSQKAVVNALVQDALCDVDEVDEQIDSLTLETGYLQSEINHFVSSMCSLRDRLDVLRKKRSNRMTMVDKCKAAASAVRLLPPEVLGVIFNYTKPTTKTEHKLYPYALCHVCITWRQAALALPALWNTDTMKFNQAEQGNLSFTLCDTRYASCTFAKHALRVISPFRHNLSSVNLHGVWLEDFFSLPPMSFPALESLHLSGDFFSAVTNVRTRVFVGALKLQKLTLDMESSSNPLLEDFPWTQITNLDIRRPVHANFIPDIFLRAINLEYAAISIDIDVQDESFSSNLSNTTTFEKLINLKLVSEIFGIKRLSALLSHTCFPVLERFTLLSKFWDGETGKASIVPALLPSVPTLYSLILTPMFLNIHDIARMLYDCSQLSSLTFVLNDEKKPSNSNQLNELANLTLNDSDSSRSPIVLERLSTLASFSAIVMCFNDSHLQTIVELFSRLTISWAHDVRKSRLESVNLSVHIPYSAHTTLTKATAQAVLQRAESDLMARTHFEPIRNKFRLNLKLKHEWQRKYDPNWESIMLTS
ncbi:hypothetical protein H2248_002234 [Termitomyces sp. 'cryptogamus']|nr:hypothetical protein H2248_002234 [Termitomyces sp. 'cryptogamus']